MPSAHPAIHSHLSGKLSGTSKRSYLLNRKRVNMRKSKGGETIEKVMPLGGIVISRRSS